MSQTVDAIVIGAGINGLVAAAELAGAGWSVALIDEQDRVGGFIASEELTLPGYVHDTYSSWHPLFMGGAGYATLGAELHRHGLAYSNTDAAVTASVSKLGSAIADRSIESTAARFEHAQDADAYVAMLQQFETWAPHVFGALGSELRRRDIAKLGAGVARRLRVAGALELARVGLQSGRGLVRERFAGWEVDQLWSPWLLHAGLNPDNASGGVMLPVMAFSMHALGLPVVTGGAGNFTAAFSTLLEERGVVTRLGAPVEHITVAGGRATGVEVAGETWTARRAVIASTSTGRLYGELLDAADVTASGQRAKALHRPGRAAMQLHLALDRPVAWADERLDLVPLVHVSDGAGSTGVACAQAEAGLLPSAPTVVVGQQSILDPSRAPEGAATLWLQLQEVPFSPSADAAGLIDTDAGWSESVTNAYVDRVIARVEEFAPNLSSSILKVTAINPVDLRAANPNAVEGDPYGGAAELDQNLIWRPGSGTGHLTGVRGLFHIGAFTHPGPGLGAGSGHLVAQRLLATHPRHTKASR